MRLTADWRVGPGQGAAVKRGTDLAARARAGCLHRFVQVFAQSELSPKRAWFAPGGVRHGHPSVGHVAGRLFKGVKSEDPEVKELNKLTMQKSLNSQ